MGEEVTIQVCPGSDLILAPSRMIGSLGLPSAKEDAPVSIKILAVWSRRALATSPSSAPPT